MMLRRAAYGNRFRRETVYGEAYDPSTDREELPPVVMPEKTPEQLKKIREKIKSTAFLKEIDEKRQTQVLLRLKLKEVKEGEVLFRQGEDANDFYIVEEGTLKVFQREEEEKTDEELFRLAMEDNENRVINEDKGEEVGTYSPSKPCIGEIALLYKDERPNTVIAASNAKLWEIDRYTYTRIVVKMAYERRKRHMNFLQNVRLLDSVENYEKVRLCDAMELRKFEKGEVIMKQGDKADGIHFVEEGEVELQTKSGEKKTLKRGDCFGELALLTTKLRDETCKAKTDCEVTFLDVEAFERLLGPLQGLIKRKPDRFKKVCKEFLGTENPDEEILR